VLGPFNTNDVTGYSYMAFIGGSTTVNALSSPNPFFDGFFISGGEAFAIENGANATINKFALGLNNDEVDLTALLANASPAQLSSPSNLFNPATGPVKFTYNNATSVTLSVTNGVNGASGTATLTLNAAPGTNFGNNLATAEFNVFNVLTTPTHT
jgi:hypothetical protein